MLPLPVEVMTAPSSVMPVKPPVAVPAVFALSAMPPL
jgi:hypothetical protein